jgi:hypothetical protein
MQNCVGKPIPIICLNTPETIRYPTHPSSSPSLLKHARITLGKGREPWTSTLIPHPRPSRALQGAAPPPQNSAHASPARRAGPGGLPGPQFQLFTFFMGTYPSIYPLPLSRDKSRG